jgi:hypothetical protein
VPAFRRFYVTDILDRWMARPECFGAPGTGPLALTAVMGSLIKKRRKRMRKKKHKKMLKRTRFQRRAKK